MEMEMFEEFTTYNDRIILKRKRSKQQKPSYSTSSSCCFGRPEGGSEFRSLVSSPATSSTVISTSTEEDEDMANCLILLAHSGSPSSRKFIEMAKITDGGKVGIYVYECKTCNKTFQSFQALGGHRASHKKQPKSITDDQIKSPPYDHKGEDHQGQLINRVISQPHSIQILSSNKGSQGDVKPKIHECSICGSEFSSGQALGGHMRRHRAALSMNTNTTAEDSSHVYEKPRNILALDLNLPAPPEDDHHQDGKFQFLSSQQSLVFSSPALVDCHY